MMLHLFWGYVVVLYLGDEDGEVQLLTYHHSQGQLLLWFKLVPLKLACIHATIRCTIKHFPSPQKINNTF